MEDLIEIIISSFFCSGYTNVVSLLLQHNASVNNIGMKNMTALLAATKSGHAETALRLLENRAIDIKVQDKVERELLFNQFQSTNFNRMDKHH
jgi:ankyrin repeat protein